MKRLKVLVGFPIGVAMLLVSYILVGLIDGPSEYLMEVTRLTDVNVLINQAFVAGIFYTIYAMWLESMLGMIIDRDDHSKVVKNFVKFLAITALEIVASFYIDKFADFAGEEVVNTLLGSGILLLIACETAYIVGNITNQYIINKKIQSRNQAKK